jgi:ATP:corrinoid adenosyltransferase
LAARPGTQHVVITGRDAPQPLLDAADLVTEMTRSNTRWIWAARAKGASSGDPGIVVSAERPQNAIL